MRSTISAAIGTGKRKRRRGAASPYAIDLGEHRSEFCILEFQFDAMPNGIEPAEFHGPANQFKDKAGEAERDREPQQH